MAAEHRVLLDSFADARRTWDDLVALQPDVKAGSRNLEERDLVELQQRIEAHRAAMDMLADAIDVEPSDSSVRQAALERGAGISNRESPDQEAAGRTEHPPIRETEPPARGRVPGAYGKTPGR